MEHIKVNLPRNKENFLSGNGEGCWVSVSEEVKEKHDAGYDGGIFEGILDNDSFYYPDLKCGAEVSFVMRGNNRPIALIDGFLEHYQALTDEAFHELIERINFKEKGAIITKRAYENKQISFLFRDYPQNDNDSGWTITSGYETEEEQTDSESYMVMHIKCILEIDQRIGEIIYTEPRCAFCLNSNDEFEQVSDFNWEAYDGE